MALRHYHGDPPAPELVNKVALGPESNPGFVTKANLCEVGSCTVIVDDPGGDTDIQAEKRWYTNEDLEDAGDIRVWFGYVDEREVGRVGAGVVYVDPLGRSWTVTLLDVNAVVGFREFPRSGTGAAAGDRPEEDPDVRIRWLLGTSQMSAVHDGGHGFVAYPTSPKLPKADYRGMYGKDVLLDLAKALQFNAYAMYCEADAQIELWLNDPNVDLFTSPLSLSNVASEIDGITVFATTFGDLKLKKTPSRVFSSVDMSGSNINVFRTRAATAAQFYPRDTTASEPTVTSLAELTRRADILLQTISTEDELVTGSVELPSEKINDVKAGHRIWIRQSHLGGFEHGEDYSAGHWMRVLSRTVRDIENKTQARRILDLELTPITTMPPLYMRLERPGGGPDQLAAAASHVTVSGYIAATDYPIWFYRDGDIPQAGDPYAPSFGPVTEIMTGIFTAPGGREWRSGFTVNTTGTLDRIAFESNAGGVIGVNSPWDFTWAIRKNGVHIAEFVQHYGATGGLASWTSTVGPGNLVATNVPVVSGDVFDVTCTWDRGIAFFVVPGGTGPPSDKFEVSG